DTVEGRLIISCAGTEALTGGAGALIKFKINAAADALGAIPLTFDQSLTEINDGGIQAGFDDGSIDVQPPVTPTVTPTITPTPTPTMSPTPTPTPAPPTQPHGRPVLHIELDKPSTIPGGGTIRYKYEWTSSGGDMPVVHGPKNETEALLRHGDGGATFDEGETWTVTVTPYNDANQPGQSFSAKFIFGKDQVTFTGWLMR
ncbi:MAG TPA: hypothetical protein PLB62_08745, partial [Candidatus Sumerlaeota bacterium]|nr:hypothetical protein [Candidatus Sumerlaeota bacterium]